MLNQTGVVKTSYGNVNQILFAPEHRIGVGVVVDDSKYVTEGGKKIVKAGTPLVGDLTKRNAVFTVYTATTQTTEGGGTTSTTTSVPVGVLEHDVDVTLGEANGSLVVFGGVNLARYDSETKKMITADVISKMPRIIFIDQP